MNATLTIGNSLPRALFHYLTEVKETLTRIGIPFEADLQLPSAERTSASEKAQYLRYMSSRTRRHSAGSYLQLWPSTGLLEALFMNRWRAPSYVIVHDPTPLRPQLGFGQAAHWLAKRAHLKRVTIVNHTDDALAVLKLLYPRAQHIQMLHPILSGQRIPQKDEGSVLVAGQFKPARDLDLLAVLGPALAKLGFHPKIVGSGWPIDIPGWNVTDRFLSEEELSTEIGRASVLCVPYKHYFQSGILIRGLEMGTLGVTAETSFANDALGKRSDLIVKSPNSVEAWVEAIKAAVANGDEATSRFNHYKQRCDDTWIEGLSYLRH